MLFLLGLGTGHCDEFPPSVLDLRYCAESVGDEHHVTQRCILFPRSVLGLTYCDELSIASLLFSSDFVTTIEPFLWEVVLSHRHRPIHIYAAIALDKPPSYEKCVVTSISLTPL